MRPMGLGRIREFANERLALFDEQRLEQLRTLTLPGILDGFSLFRPAYVISSAASIIGEALDTFICLSEQKLYDTFLRDVAIFVAQGAFGGRQSPSPGVDLELENGGVCYLIIVRSGLGRVSGSEYSRLAEDLRDASARVKESRGGLNAQPVLGICYGKARTSCARDGYLTVVGKDLWYLISGDKALYTDIIEPVGYRAREHNEAFDIERSRVVNRFTRQFVDRFCDPSGAIDWIGLVEFNSGNYDLDRFLT